MLKQEFENFWESNFGSAFPISSLLKHQLPKNWFRIHSLPESKRYPKTKTEWKILLSRQNKIISDLIGNSSKIILLTGEYGDKDGVRFKNKFLLDFQFIALEPIDMVKACPEIYDDGIIYFPYIAKVRWDENKFEKILRSIANDEVRAKLICVEKNRIIAPYDGGVDLILENEEAKDFYKNKYKDWLSDHQLGL